MNLQNQKSPKSRSDAQKSFRTLDLAVKFYQMVQEINVPRHLKDQLDRASSSISLNLAEGNAKFSYKDKSRIYQIAYGSFRECQTILKLADIKDVNVLEITKHLGSSLYRLIEAAKARSVDNT